MPDKTTYKYYGFTEDSLLAHDQELVKGLKKYTDENGGKIDVIKVNGTAQTISATDKSVDVTVPTKTSELTNNSGFITTNDIPEGAAASTTVPKMDGTAAAGVEKAFARGDHVHPTDTSRASAADLTALSTKVGTIETKIADVAESADENTIEVIKVNGTAQTISATDKSVNISVPTDNKSLTNGAGYQTAANVKSSIEGYGYQTSADVSSAISTHNASTTAHSDIRTSLSDLNTKLSNFLDSDDTTLDQLSELIAAIKANQTSVESLTSGKVNVADVHIWTADEATTIATAALA